MSKQTVADGLRALADFLDGCDESCGQLNESGIEVTFFALGSKADEARSVAAIAKRLRTFEKSYSDTLMTISKKFGLVTGRFVAFRESVCERVVVGTETIPETVIPAVEAKPEQVIPARVVEKVEWRCDKSLLDEQFDSLASA